MSIIFLSSLFFSGCQQNSNVEQVSLSGGSWSIENSKELSIHQAGIGFHFFWNGYVYGYCIFNCRGIIGWPNDDLQIDVENAMVNISSFSRLDAKISDGNTMVYNTNEVAVQSVYGDVWVEALPVSSVSILSSYGDVDVNVPAGNWVTRLSGYQVVSQIPSIDDEPAGHLEVYNIDGTIRVVEMKALSSF